jgi:hypothetical protein
LLLCWLEWLAVVGGVGFRGEGGGNGGNGDEERIGSEFMLVSVPPIDRSLYVLISLLLLHSL